MPGRPSFAGGWQARSGVGRSRSQPAHRTSAAAAMLLPRAAAAGRIFSLGLCSLSGHQLAGEERFQLELHADGSVW